MKRIIITVLVLIAVRFTLYAVNCSAEDVFGLLPEISADGEQAVTPEDRPDKFSEEVTGQIDEILEEYDIFYKMGDMNGLSFGGFFGAVKDTLVSRIVGPFRLLGILILIILFSAFVQSMGETTLNKDGNSNMFNLFCIISAVTVISQPLVDAFSFATATIERGGMFMLIFIPIFAGISFFSGNLTSASAYNLITAGAAELFVQISKYFLMPLVALTVSLAIINSINPKSTTEGLINMIRKVVTWSITVAATLFTGFLTLKSKLSVAADGAATKTVKFMISGCVPVIGGAVSDAYGALKGSVSLVKTTAGTAGIFAVILILLPPIAELFGLRLVMWIGGAVAEMFSVKPLEKLLKSLDAGLSIAISLIVGFSLLFIISTASLLSGG